MSSLRFIRCFAVFATVVIGLTAPIASAATGNTTGTGKKSTTNTVGNGNAHIADSSLGNGSFYVVLTDASGNEAFASAPVSVN